MKEFNFLKYICIIFVLCLSFFSAYSSEFDYYAKKYPSAYYVEISAKNLLEINMKGDKPEILLTCYSESMLLSENAALFVNESIEYSSKVPIVSINAYTLIPTSDGKYKKEDVTNFDYGINDDSNVFFDDSRVCTFTYPNLSKGCKKVCEVKYKIDDLYYVPSLELAAPFHPLISSEVKIIYDNRIDLKLYKFNVKDEDFSVDKFTKSGKKNIIELKLENFPGNKYEIDYMQNKSQYFKKIYPVVQSYKNKKKEIVPVLPDIAHLYKYYVENHLGKIDTANVYKLKPVADSITAGITDEFEKVKKIYYWMQDNIKYVAIEDGDNGVVPMNAYNVYVNRHGDCKGMSNLIYQLLKQSGIKSYLTWVGARNIPFNYSQIPSPFIDNHQICTYFNKGNFYVLDVTSKFQNITEPPTFIQGKECLIAISEDSFLVKKIPLIKDVIRRNFEFNLNEKSIIVKGRVTLRGESSHDEAYYLSRRPYSEQKKYFQLKLNEARVANSSIDLLKISDLKDRDSLCVDINYRVNDYLIVNNSKVYLSPFFVGLDEKKFSSERTVDVEFDSKQDYLWNYKINIPKNYVVESLIPNLNYSSKDFSLSINCKKVKNYILLSVDYKVNTIRLTTDEFEEWNKMNDIIASLFSQSIVFKIKK